MTLDDLDARLEPFLRAPERSGILTDFDGTLAPIVEDPLAARPLDGAVELLHDLARRYRRVAVVSGRPASFLVKRLHAADEGLVLFGLYGLEMASAGVVTAHPDCEHWQPMVRRMADEADEQLPDTIFVERKGLTVTLHFRTVPDLEPTVHDWVHAAAERSGLAVHPARMSYELVPPIPIDKGRVVHDLSTGLQAVCFFGDDLGDLPAFAALDDLRAEGVDTLKVAARSPEAPEALYEEADVLVDGPPGALALLSRLLPQKDPQPAARS